jgi:hypothetical protein
MVARNRAIIFSLWRGGSWGPNNHNNNTIRLEAGELTCSSASALAALMVQDGMEMRAHRTLSLPEKVHAACFITSELQCALLLTACVYTLSLAGCLKDSILIESEHLAVNSRHFHCFYK